jgi:O-antigen ligase
VLVGAPWPFGSATPRPAGYLTAALYLLFGLWVSYLFLSNNLRRYSWPAARWIVLGVALGLLQLTPIPEGLMSVVAPASHAVHYPDVPEAHDVLGEGWRPLSIEPFATETELLRFGSLIAAFFLVGHLFSRRNDVRLLAFTVTALGVALCFFAVYQQAKWGTLLYGRFPVPSATPFGPFVNHNHFAGIVEMCALVALGASIGHIGRQSPATSILLGGGAAVMGIALILSRSRGSLIAASAGAILLGILALRTSARARSAALAVWGAAVALIVLLAAPQSVFDRMDTFANPGQDVSVQFRLNLWRDSLRLAKHSPVLGTGVGTYAAAIPAYRTDRDETRAEHAESDWMEHACETGLAGLVVLVGFIFVVARRALNRLEKEDAVGRTRGILLGATAGAFALLVHSLFDFNTRVPSNALMLAVLLGTLIGAKVGRKSYPAYPIGARLVASLLILGLALTASWRSTTLGLSRHASWQADPFLAEPEEFARVAAELAQARDFAASNPQAAFKRGILYQEEAYRSVDAERYRDLRFAQARSAFEEAVRMAPARGRYWFELAWTEGSLRHDAVADPVFAHALSLEPTWARLRANYALYLVSRGRMEEALEQIEIGRSLKPGISAHQAVSIMGPYANRDAAILRRAAGEGEKAEEAVTRYLAQETR